METAKLKKRYYICVFVVCLVAANMSLMAHMTHYSKAKCIN